MRYELLLFPNNSAERRLQWFGHVEGMPDFDRIASLNAQHARSSRRTLDIIYSYTSLTNEWLAPSTDDDDYDIYISVSRIASGALASI